MAEHLKPIVEAMIFASPEPLTKQALFKLLDAEPKEDVDAALDRLKQALEANDEAAVREQLFGFIAETPEPTGPATARESVAQGA